LKVCIYIKITFHKSYSIDKEIQIAIKLGQPYQEYLQDKQSPEYRELSGNVEQAVSLYSFSYV